MLKLLRRNRNKTKPHRHGPNAGKKKRRATDEGPPSSQPASIQSASSPLARCPTSPLPAVPRPIAIHPRGSPSNDSGIEVDLHDSDNREASVGDTKEAIVDKPHLYVEFPMKIKRGSVVVPPLWNGSREGWRWSTAESPNGDEMGCDGGDDANYDDRLGVRSSSNLDQRRPLQMPTDSQGCGETNYYDRSKHTINTMFETFADVFSVDDATQSTSKPVATASCHGNGSGTKSMPGLRRIASETKHPSGRVFSRPFSFRLLRRPSHVTLETVTHNTGKTRRLRMHEIAVPKYTRVVADQMLARRSAGSFLFRESKGAVVLSVFDGDNVHHLHVQSDNMAVSPHEFKGAQFRSFIRHYQTKFGGQHGPPIQLKTLIME